MVSKQGSRESYPIHEAVIETIVQLPAPGTTVDPYKPGAWQAGIPVLPDYDYRYSPDGRVEFGRRFDTRRVMVVGHEVVLAANQEPVKSAVLINTFAMRGGLAHRDWFRNEPDGTIKKRHEAAPWGAILDGGPSFSRQLEPAEEQALLTIVSDPEAHYDSLAGLVTLTEVENDLLETSRAEIKEMNDRLNADLEAIAEAQREAWRQAPYTLIW